MRRQLLRALTPARSSGPSVRSLLVLAAGLAVLPLLPPFSPEYAVTWLVYAVWIGALAIAFDFSAGYINVVNFGYAAFIGVGAYASAILSVRTGLSPWFGLLLSPVVGGLLGLLTGAITLRFRGIYTAVTAWFLSLALLGLVTNLTDLTRGNIGLTAPPFFATAGTLTYYYMALAMLVVTFAVLGLIVRSRAGLAFRALGQSYDAARASGINPARYRIMNFGISCAFAGWLGGFYASYYGVLTPSIMDTTITVQVLVATLIGGIGTFWGPAVGGVAIAYLGQWLQTRFTDLPGMDGLIYGLLLIAIILICPGGIADLASRVATRLRGRARAVFARPADVEPASR